MGLKVYDLQCAHGHRFEGWFGSDDDFRAQSDRKLIACPLCDDVKVQRVPSAARLNTSQAQQPVEETKRPQEINPSPVGPARVPAVQTSGVDLQAMWLQAVRHVMAHTEDVGDRFASEARDIHEGRSEQRGIRGTATPDETAELREAGIEVHSIPMPAALKGTLQ
jgi:hypothetical protein